MHVTKIGLVLCLTISRQPIGRAEADTANCRYSTSQNVWEELKKTNPEEDLFVTDQRLHAIRQETAKDASLQTLMTVIRQGGQKQ